ncbi:hypothetical protein [Nocardioides insulae]|uniref:hypothetical protein n=1 Tax=Nocardioides insulae TaxID=394734 RepID=UPI00040099F4|nr:hypothetical protein [Nocardioides insulae]
MLPLGLVLLGVGVVVLALGIVTTSDNGADPATMLGLELGATTIFLLGTFAGLAVLLGLWLTKVGTRQGLQRRRDARQLARLKKEQGEAEVADRPEREAPPAPPGPPEAPREQGPPRGETPS